MCDTKRLRSGGVIVYNQREAALTRSISSSKAGGMLRAECTLAGVTDRKVLRNRLATAG
jgi:hypothetical protein